MPKTTGNLRDHGEPDSPALRARYGPSPLAVTIDLEDWYHIPSVSGSPFSVYQDTDTFFDTWNGRYDYLSRPTARVLDLLDEYRISATFFVVADVIARYPGLVETIVERGHEIGCHGLDHRCKIHPVKKGPLVSPDAFRERTMKAKRMLETAAKKRVVGYRAPNALVAGWMLDAIEEIGFLYDSSVSVNSLYSKTDSSLAGISSTPYRPRRGNLVADGNRPFIEYPWGYWEICGLKIPVSGGPMLRFLGSGIVLAGLRQSLARGPSVLYFHPIDISEERFPTIGRGRPLYWSIKGGIVERRLRTILSSLAERKVPMAPMGEVLGLA